MVRRSLSIVAFCAGVLLIPCSSAAAETAVASCDYDPPQCYGHLGLEGTADASRTIVSLKRGATTYIVHDNTGILAHMNCELLTLREAECQRFGKVDAFMDAGDDLFRLSAYARGTANGGPGSDDLIGGSRDDVLAGGIGDDDVLGRGGDDVVNGGAGEDALRGGAGDDIVGRTLVAGEDGVFGGSGDDKLSAVDRRRDTRINCGSGHDSAKIDPTDPKPVNCERIRVVH